MKKLLAQLARQVPSTVQVLADVSNLKQRQLDRETRRMLLLSTHKTFNYKRGTDTLPDVGKGTRWIVLRLPYGILSRPHRTVFRSGKFVPVRNRSSPVHIEYHKGSKCSLVRSRSGKRMSQKRHSVCEVDDYLIHQLSLMLGLDVLTNDRRLHEGGKRPSTALLEHTRFTVLVSDGKGGWREA